MRIGLITGEYPPMQGGVGAFTRELARAFVSAGHVPHILTDQAAEEGTEAGIHLSAAIQNWNLASLGAIQNWARHAEVEIINLQFQAAAYNMAGLIHLLPNLLRRLPLVVTFHDLLVPYLFPKAGGLRTRAVTHLARSAAGVIVTNPADEQQLIDTGGVKALRRIPIGSNIPHTPPPDYDRARWRRTLGIPSEAFVLGYFGFMNASKGIETLLQGMRYAIDQGAGVYLLLIGGRVGVSDPTNLGYADQIDRYIQTLNLTGRVHRTGFVGESEVSANLLCCDLLVLPYSDGVSLRRGSFMAGLAHGCPILTTTPKVPHPEIQDGQNVALIPPDNPTALCAALLRLIADPTRRAALGQGAQTLAQSFRWDQIASETVRFFQSL